MTKPIDILTGGQHSRDIAAMTCTTCGGEAREFRDVLSLKESTISGMCQTCQDEVFGGGETGC
jgi:hypothetical protein